jgi:hypothetical protein
MPTFLVAVGVALVQDEGTGVEAERETRREDVADAVR